ncbi:MAG: RNA 3'-terminal phosphate cyclase [Aquificae bacterium]|nr:RNA 3'-terminal phosphate cyclase [Aquificota bacterium]
MGEYLSLDASYGEGGGQILRVALMLSSILRVPVHLYNVRVKRESPGLRPQHLNVVKFLKRLTKARVKGDELGSTELFFEPRTLKAGSYEVNFDTAGSISLFLQAVLPVLLFVPGETSLRVIGGTDVPKSPTIDWFRFVFLPELRRGAEELTLTVVKRGFYPEGGGTVELKVKSFFGEVPSAEEVRSFARAKLRIEKLERKGLKRLHVFSVAHEELRSRKVAERQASGAAEALKEAGLPAPEVYRQYAQARSLGSSVTAWAEDEAGNLLGADALGKKGKPSERVGREAAEKLIKDLKTGAPVDEHLADHLIPLLGLAGGVMRVPRLTGHLEACAWTVEQFLGPTFKRDGLVFRAG